MFFPSGNPYAAQPHASKTSGNYNPLGFNTDSKPAAKYSEFTRHVLSHHHVKPRLGLTSACMSVSLSVSVCVSLSVSPQWWEDLCTLLVTLKPQDNMVITVHEMVYLYFLLTACLTFNLWLSTRTLRWPAAWFAIGHWEFWEIRYSLVIFTMKGCNEREMLPC